MGTLGKTVRGKWILAAALAGSGCAAHAAAEDEALAGAVADGLTTAVGLAAGAVELNPVGPVLAIGMKLAVYQYAKGLPDTEQPRVRAAAGAIWQGAAANNLCVAASILSGGSLVPACIALGVAWGVRTWQASEPERQFWEACALLRQYAQEPSLTCVYTLTAAGPSLPDPRVAVTTALVSREAP